MGQARAMVFAARRRAMLHADPRSVAVVGLLLTAVIAIAGQQGVRLAEARLGAGLGELVAPGVGRVRVSGTEFALWAGTTHARLYDVQAACSITPFVAAVLMIGAGMLFFDGSFRIPVMLRRIALIVLGLLVANVVRIALIVTSIGLFGPRSGYDIGHKDIGTIFMLVAVGLALWCLARTHPHLHSEETP